MKESPEQGYGAKAHGSQVAESCGGVWAFGKIRLAETRPSKGATGRSKGLVFSDSPLSGKTSNLEFAVNFYDFEISNGGRASFHLSSKVPSPSEYSIFHPVLATEKLKGKLCYGDFWRSFPFLIKGTLSISVPGFLPGNWKWAPCLELHQTPYNHKWQVPEVKGQQGGNRDIRELLPSLGASSFRLLGQGVR